VNVRQEIVAAIVASVRGGVVQDDDIVQGDMIWPDETEEEPVAMTLEYLADIALGKRK
jgi:hypothetical protein